MSRQPTVVLDAGVQAYIDSVKEKAEALVKVKFPGKVVELNALLESSDFSVDDPTKFYQPLNIPSPDAQAITKALNNHSNNHAPVKNEISSPPTRGKKRKVESISEDDNDVIIPKGGTVVLALPSGPVSTNQYISHLIDVVKPQIRGLVKDSNLLKMWVTFLIPKIEDGNNFGVSIQEDTLGEIRTVEAEAAAFYDQISRYFLTRGKMVSKVAKYPHIEDYRKLIYELDEKEVLSLHIVLSEVRNHYAALYDLIFKNMEKIIRPRTSNAENLY